MTASVFGQVDDADLGIPGGDFLQDTQHIVGRAVVDSHDLIVKVGLLGHDLADLVDHQTDGTLAGVTGDDEGDNGLLVCAITHFL